MQRASNCCNRRDGVRGNRLFTLGPLTRSCDFAASDPSRPIWMLELSEVRAHIYLACAEMRIGTSLSYQISGLSIVVVRPPGQEINCLSGSSAANLSELHQGLQKFTYSSRKISAQHHRRRRRWIMTVSSISQNAYPGACFWLHSFK